MEVNTNSEIRLRSFLLNFFSDLFGFAGFFDAYLIFQRVANGILQDIAQKHYTKVNTKK